MYNKKQENKRERERRALSRVTCKRQLPKRPQIFAAQEPKITSVRFVWLYRSKEAKKPEAIDYTRHEVSFFSNTGANLVPTEFSTSMFPSYPSIETGHVRECSSQLDPMANVTEQLRSRKLTSKRTSPFCSAGQS